MTEPQPLRDFRLAVEQNRVSPGAAKQFRDWRDGRKFPPHFTAAADKLWARYEQMAPAKKHQASPAPVSDRFKAKNTPVNRQRPYEDRTGTSSRGNSKKEAPRAEPSHFGSPFHNPYTFIPFPNSAPHRRSPTPISVDEQETDRITGVIDLEIKLLSPLMTTMPDPVSERDGHKTMGALSFGEDVILPATGVRGALRNLMTVLTGSTLSYIDEEAWLCQGRDLPLSGDNAILAEVIVPGSFERPGKLRLGETRLVLASQLEAASKGNLPRPRPNSRVQYLWSNSAGNAVSKSKDAEHPWKVKLSGNPVGGRHRNEKKKEGLFKAREGAEGEIEAPAHLWAAYCGRNRHGDHPELQKGDLVWLEANPTTGRISSAKDIASIQWARWGRRGERLLDLVERLHPNLIPDAFNPDGLVDEITDLFGQIPRPEQCSEIHRFRNWKDLGKPGPAPAFAARVRPGNLMFEGARKTVERSTLAPLMPPHPGCAAFYRDAGDDISEAASVVANKGFPLRGFKTYRTSQRQGKKGPWNYDAQPVFDNRSGQPSNSQQKVNKTVDLLPPGQTGQLRLTVRALSLRELSLIIAACCVDWRLGGGKPLGLGHCRVSSIRIRPFDDVTGMLEHGDQVELAVDSLALDKIPAQLREEVCKDNMLTERMRLWQASQNPVELLRYPRAVSENKNKKNRGGHVWFGRHANPKKSKSQNVAPGLEAFHLDDHLSNELRHSAIRGQPLPHLDAADPTADALFGYDLFIGNSEEWIDQQKNGQKLHRKFEPFDPAKHARPRDGSGGFQGQNRDSRQKGRRNRRH